MYHYHFAVASQTFFLDQEPMEEILRERTNYYISSNKEIDFWFTLNPCFYYDINKSLNKKYTHKSLAAIISLDKDFIQWLKLRVAFVETGSFESNIVFLPESS
uniref:Ycf54 n=1 Tax=Vertebrata thuyoides TaxID=2006970 RepID=A0A1Z1MAB2_9FLOR|nr:hypothetical protein [Vertebrata thuyoides]ARW63027.1 hypothetical protein [Vertebrata thuyoides]